MPHDLWSEELEAKLEDAASAVGLDPDELFELVCGFRDLFRVIIAICDLRTE